MGIQFRTKLNLCLEKAEGEVMNKLILLLVAVLLVFSSSVLACAEIAHPEEIPEEITHPKEEFILVGTGGSGGGAILLYRFYPTSPQPDPFPAQQEPMLVANFGNGTVQGLDILDYENDGDLDFIALVRSETSPGTDVWEYDLHLFMNSSIFNNEFTDVPIPDNLPDINGAWVAALADCTAADFDYPYLLPPRVDFIVSIGSADPTMIYKFRNCIVGPPFEQLDNPLTENWATHARRMDTADFNGDGRGDFATFDYPVGTNFTDDIVIRYRGDVPFCNPLDFDGIYWITQNTPASIATITAGQFDNDTWPDVIVGGDDDGDPGQYWLYKNDGTGGFEHTPVGVFDLGPSEWGSAQPGAGVADAYDFDTDGMMDVVATAGDIPVGQTTIYYIERTGSGTFASPLVIDTITTAQYGSVWSIAAPMTTDFGVG